MLRPDTPSLPAAQRVGRHVIGAHFTEIAVLQIAEVAADIDPPLAHEGRHQRCIPVGRNVPVVRLYDLDTVDVVDAQGGRQEAAFSTVVEREADGRERRRRQPHETQLGIFSHADAFIGVGLDTCGAQHPRRHPAGPILASAGGVAGLPRHRAAFINEVDALGFAMAAGRQETIAGVVEKPLESLELEFEFGSLIHIARLIDTHIATRLGQVVGLVVIDAIGSDDGVATAQHGIALDRRFEVGPSRQAITGHEAGKGAALVAWQVFGQLRRRFQPDGCIECGLLGLGRSNVQQGECDCRQRHRGKAASKRQRKRIARTQAHGSTNQIRHRQEQLSFRRGAAARPALSEILVSRHCSLAGKRPAPGGFVESDYP